MTTIEQDISTDTITRPSLSSSGSDIETDVLLSRVEVDARFKDKDGRSITFRYSDNDESLVERAYVDEDELYIEFYQYLADRKNDTWGGEYPDELRVYRRGAKASAPDKTLFDFSLKTYQYANLTKEEQKQFISLFFMSDTEILFDIITDMTGYSGNITHENSASPNYTRAIQRILSKDFKHGEVKFALLAYAGKLMFPLADHQIDMFHENEEFLFKKLMGNTENTLTMFSPALALFPVKFYTVKTAEDFDIKLFTEAWLFGDPSRTLREVVDDGLTPVEADECFFEEGQHHLQRLSDICEYIVECYVHTRRGDNEDEFSLWDSIFDMSVVEFLSIFLSCTYVPIFAVNFLAGVDKELFHKKTAEAQTDVGRKRSRRLANIVRNGMKEGEEFREKGYLYGFDRNIAETLLEWDEQLSADAYIPFHLFKELYREDEELIVEQGDDEK